MEEEYEEERRFLEEEQRELKRQEREQQRYYEYNGADSGSNLYDKIRNGASNFQDWKSSLNLDPFAIFEDFFFQESTMGDANNMDSTDGEYRYDKAQNPFGNQQQSTSNQEQSKLPPHVSESTMYRGFDPSFGADVYTVLRREEFIHDVNENGEYFYQILGQDFISGKRVDPFTGFTMQEYYSAVTEPYFVEEGFSTLNARGDDSNHHAKDFHYRQNKQQHAQPQSSLYRKSETRLEEGESLTPDLSPNERLTPWVSLNGKYEAILTRTCELQIVRHEDEQQDQSQSGDKDNSIIWSSETYIPYVRASGCYLTLNSMGRLVLSVDYGSGLDSIGNTVLWNTPSPPVVPHWFEDEDENAKQQPVTFRYHASLDNDGVIAVYRVREKIVTSDDDNKQGKKNDIDDKIPNTSASDVEGNNYLQSMLQIRPLIDKMVLMYHRISKSSIEQGQTKAALAFHQVRYSVGRMFVSRPWLASMVPEDSQQQGKFQSSYEECVYSTSPVGCLSPGRNAIHLTKKIARTLKRSVQSLDSHLDHFLSSLTEPASEYDYDDYESQPNYNDEEDEDILDTLLRVTGAAGYQLGSAGAHLGKAGVHAAQMGMKRGKKVAGKMVGKMKDRMGKPVRWGEKLAEEEEVNQFF